jgi:hypothetical protein
VLLPIHAALVCRLRARLTSVFKVTPNEPCFELSSLLTGAVSTLAAGCVSTSQCANGQYCNVTSGTCMFKPKVCSSAKTCSGHGDCYYANTMTGARVDVCWEGSIDCYARCACDQGYSGTNCLHAIEELRQNYANRGEAYQWSNCSSGNSRLKLDVL